MRTSLHVENASRHYTEFVRTLSRFVAAATLLLILATTTANYWCALCEPRPSTTTGSGHCHESTSASGLRVAAGHDCSEHAGAEIIAAARTEPTIVLIAEAPRTVAALIRASLSAARPAALRAGPPALGLHTIPLRI